MSMNIYDILELQFFIYFELLSEIWNIGIVE
jgi:hypothetical protein